MINKGDKVVCIDDGPYVTLNEPTYLTKYKQYTVLNSSNNITYGGSITVMNDDGKINYAYKISRFMLYEEWLSLHREEQIKSILYY